MIMILYNDCLHTAIMMLISYVTQQVKTRHLSSLAFLLSLMLVHLL